LSPASPGWVKTSKRLPFTQPSLTRAILGVEKAGKFVIGVKPDGTLIISDKPFDVASLLPAQPQNDPDSIWEDKKWEDKLDQSPAPKRRMGDYLNGGHPPPRKTAMDYFESTSKWEDKRADEHNSPLPTPKRR